MTISKWTLEETRKWPRNVRHSLTQRVELLTIEILEDITAAAYGYRREARLESINDSLNRLRVLMRLANELAILSHERYAMNTRMLSKAGRKLGSWMQKEGLQRTKSPALSDGHV